MTDYAFAVAHHLLVFALAGIIAFEIATMRPEMTAPDLSRIAKVDLWYGIIAGAIVIVGFSRAIFAAKGWAYYSHNVFFWAKLATFAVIGLLSVPPTIAYIGWRRANIVPNDVQIHNVRRFLWIEVVLFALLPAFAAAMARGYGEMG